MNKLLNFNELPQFCLRLANTVVDVLYLSRGKPQGCAVLVVYTAELFIFYVMQPHCSTSELFIAEL
jgi:hypothetical protein